MTLQPLTSGLARCGTTIALVAVALLAGCGSSKKNTEPEGAGGSDDPIENTDEDSGTTTPSGETGGGGTTTVKPPPPNSDSGTTPPAKPDSGTTPVDPPANPQDGSTVDPVDPPESDECEPIIVAPVPEAGTEVVDAAESPFGKEKDAGAVIDATAEGGVKEKGLLDKTKWTVMEVSGEYHSGEDYYPGKDAIDGNLATRWSDGKVQADNATPTERQRLLIDLGSSRRVCRIVIDSRGASPGPAAPNEHGFAKTLDLYLSDDPKPVEPTYTGQGQPVTEIRFEKAKKGRYLGIVNRGSDNVEWWSIYEVSAYR